MLLACLLGACLPETATVEPGRHPDVFDWNRPAESLCPPDCWYGLEPGRSTKSETLVTIQALPFLNPQPIREVAVQFWDRVSDEQRSGQEVGFECTDFPGQGCVRMRFYGDTLAEIIADPITEITVQQLVEKLGEPDGHREIRINAETKGCELSLYWRDRNLVVFYSEDTHLFGKDLCEVVARANGKVPADLPVDWAIIERSEWMDWLYEVVEISPWVGFVSE